MNANNYADTDADSCLRIMSLCSIPYDLCISELHVPLNWQVQSGCQHEKLYEFV